MLTNNNNIIKICILEISDQNRAILEFYFDSAGKSLYKQTIAAHADAYITDFDFPGAKEHWENIYSVSKKPGIILSISEKNIDSTIWLAKPLTANSLTGAAKDLQELLTSKAEAQKAVEKPQKIETETPTQKEAEITQQTTEKVGAVALAEESLDGNNSLSASDILDFDDQIVETEIKQAIENEPVETADTTEDDKEVDELLASLINGKGADHEVPAEEEKQNIIADLDEMTLLQEDTLSVENNNLTETEENTEKEEDTKKSDLSFDMLIDYSNESETSNALDDFDLDVISNEEHNKVTKDNNAAEHASLDEFPGISLEPKPEENHEDKEALVLQSAEVSNMDDKIDDSIIEPIEEFDTPEIKVSTSVKSERLTELNSDPLESQLKSIEVEYKEVSPELKENNNNLDNDLKIDIADANPNKTAEQELQALLNEIRQEADKASEAPEIIGTNTAQKKARIFKPTNAEKRWDLLCGNNSDINKAKDVKSMSFNLEDHLLSVILDNIQQAKVTEEVMRLKHKDFVIVIDYSMDYIYCDQSIFSDEYAELCYQPIDAKHIKIHELDNSEIRMYRKRMEEDPQTSNTVESFIWTTTLVTSRGRLLNNTDIKKKVGLKAWPNLTRLENIPHAMRIAAVFCKHPGSLEDIPKLLKIPQRYILAFYNAAFFLDMIETDSTKLKQSSTTFATDTSSTEKVKQRGFFNRLLKRITS